MSDAAQRLQSVKWRRALSSRFRVYLAVCGILGFAGLLGTVPLITQPWFKAQKKHGFLHRVHLDSSSSERKYMIFVPYSYEYEGSGTFPVLLLLHGWGDKGEDGSHHVGVGLGPAVSAQQKTFPFITVFPQGREGIWSPGDEDWQLALGILDEIEREFRVDRSRIYLTGISSGATGAWEMAARLPNKWAALVLLSGSYNPRNVEKVTQIPCWIFQAPNDKKLEIEATRNLVAELKAAGGNANYTEIRGVGLNNHNVWDRAYSTPKLYTWLLEQRVP